MHRVVLSAIAFLTAFPAPAQTFGLFEAQSDIGRLAHPGAAVFDAAANTYTVTSSGENMWAAEDDFHFVWKKISGDVMITASIAFPDSTGNAHKKGAIMMRGTLDADSEYVDAAFHLSGLTSLQSRGEKGGVTREVQSYIASPRRVRLVKSGINFYMYVAGEDGVFHFAGGSMQLRFGGPFYIGLAACAHDKEAVERVSFSEVEIVSLPPAQNKSEVYYTLETQSGDRRALWVEKGRVQAPHWSPDEKTIFFTENGRMAKIATAGGSRPETVATGDLSHIDAHTGLSPDGRTLAITDHEQIYTVPAAGGEPHLVTTATPSMFCSWSADSKTILLIGIRHAERQLLTVAAEGGPETVVDTEGRVDNPVWSADGKYIYFDSTRGGTSQIWRARADGTQREPLTSGSEFINSDPHPSPDGTTVAFLSVNYPLAMVRAMNLSTKTIRIMAIFPNAQGTLASSPWSSDSKSISFISFQNAPF